MITKLEIEGFKSFGATAQTISLGPLNFVVGANATGKTNLLAALQFLQYAVMDDVESAVTDMGGVAAVRNKGPKTRKEPRFVISLEMDGREMSLIGYEVLGLKYTIELDLSKHNAAPRIKDERLTAKLRSKKGRTSNFFLSRNQYEVVIEDPTQTPRNSKQIIKVPPQEATRLAVDVGFFSPMLVGLRDVIENWQFYNISPSEARKPSKEVIEIDLGPAGEDLPMILHKLEQQKDKQALESVIAGLKSAVPGFRGLKTVQLPVEGTWAFQILETKIRGAINPQSASDGTIKLLALMVISSWTAKHSSLIVIEEPENGLHPHLSGYIVEILRTASESAQVLVTTHNPSFLDYVTPKEVILCDKVEGSTIIKHASDVPQIKKFQKHFSLGDLWIQGTLGGTP